MQGTRGGQPEKAPEKALVFGGSRAACWNRNGVCFAKSAAGAGPTVARPHVAYRNSTTCSGRALGGGVAPGAGTGGTDGAHAMPVLRPAAPRTKQCAMIARRSLLCYKSINWPSRQLFYLVHEHV